MKCPYCGGPMDEGKIYSSRREAPLYWLPKEIVHPFLDFYNEDRIHDQGGYILDDAKFPYLHGRYKTAWHCPECRAMLFGTATIWPGEEEPDEET